MNNEKLFEDVLRELNTTDVIDDFKYKSIVNLDQFNEGLEYLTDQIKLISRIIYDMTDENLVSSKILNESNSEMRKKWENAKELIAVRINKVVSINSILRDFILNKTVIKNGIKFRVTRENLISSQSMVEDYTEEVEDTAQRYYNKAKKLSAKPYPLYDTIRVYNMSVTCFNRVLNDCRARFDISLDELPDASVL